MRPPERRDPNPWRPRRILSHPAQGPEGRLLCGEVMPGATQRYAAGRAAPSSSRQGPRGPRLASHPDQGPQHRRGRGSEARSELLPFARRGPGEAGPGSCPGRALSPLGSEPGAEAREEAGRLRLCGEAPGLGPAVAKRENTSSLSVLSILKAQNKKWI